MKILVTGSTGFVGSHLCDLLKDAGHEVFSLVRTPKKAEEFNVQGQYIKGSLQANGELEWINDLPNDLEAVIHTAGIVHASDAKVFDKINNQASTNLVKNLEKRYKSLHFTFVSSLAAGGPTEKNTLRTEAMEDGPVSEYGRSKNRAEKALKEIIPADWTYNCIRPPMVIGPRDSAVLDIFKMVKSGVIVGPGLGFKNKEYSFICVNDLTMALKVITESQVSGTFYIGHEEVVSFEKLISTIGNQLKKKNLIHISVPAPVLKTVAKISSMLPISSRLTTDKVNELLPMAWTCSNQLLTEKAQFTPSWNIEKTVEVTANDYIKRGWL